MTTTWSAGPKDRAIELLVERVDYHGGDGNVSIGLRSSGIKILVGELATRKEEAA